MRNKWPAFLGLVALVLVSCARPGGVYRGYEGPDRDARDIAILTWSRPVVTHIDGKDLHEADSLVTGIQITIAHLPPGPHTLSISHDWEDLYYRDPDGRYLDLHAEFQSGQSYVVHEASCQDCDPFSVVFWIADAVTGVPLVQTTMIGSEPYGEARKERKKKCREECREDYSWCPLYGDDEESRQCREEKSDCESDCYSNIEFVGDLFDLFRGQ